MKSHIVRFSLEVVPFNGKKSCVGLLVEVATNGLWYIMLEPDFLDVVILLLTESEGIAPPDEEIRLGVN